MMSVQLAPGYVPRKWAEGFHASAAKLKVVWVHRRGGKGWAAEHEGLKAYWWALRTNPKMELIPGFHAWTVAPNFPQARQSENELEVFLPAWARPNATQWDQSRGHRRDEHTFVLRGSRDRREGLWEVKSAFEPEALQTVGLDFLHVTECQDIPETAFNRMLATLRSPGRMGLSVWEGIPPDDPDHWFARIFYDASKGEDADRQAFFVPYTANSDLTAGDIKALEKDREVMLEREWKRMWLCELPTGEGAFLGNVDGCIVNLPLLTEAESDHRYVMGVDLAKKVDYTVIIVMDACHRRLVWHRQIRQMDWNVQEEAIKYAHSQFQVRRIRLDSTGVGDPVFDRLRFDGLPVDGFVFTNESKYGILTALAIGIEKHLLAYPNLPEMLRELRSVRASKLPSGRSRVESTAGTHDDYVMALAMAYSLCDPPPADLAKWQDIKPMRYAPVVDTLVPGGIIEAKGAVGFLERRRLARQASRIKELEALGVL